MSAHTIDKELEDLREIVETSDVKNQKNIDEVVDFVRDSIQVITHGQNVQNRIVFTESNYKSAEGKGGIRFFSLPGSYHRVGDPFGPIIEDYKAESWLRSYYGGKNNMYARVLQGTGWSVENTTNPHLFASVSQCSCLIGIDGKQTAVIHVSYSEKNQMEAAIRWLKENNMKIYAVASLRTAEDKTNSTGFLENRFDTIRDYEEAGISKENIIPFYYRDDKGVMQMVVTPTHIMSFRLSENKNGKEEVRDRKITQIHT